MAGADRADRGIVGVHVGMDYLAGDGPVCCFPGDLASPGLALGFHGGYQAGDWFRIDARLSYGFGPAVVGSELSIHRLTVEVVPQLVVGLGTSPISLRIGPFAEALSATMITSSDSQGAGTDGEWGTTYGVGALAGVSYAVSDVLDVELDGGASYFFVGLRGFVVVSLAWRP